ncbi:MAG: peptidyl-prolyl cis-trans isomerase [Sulfuricellaceae bacterium]|nr:peptidyl-prolyl cis-trans isomerase [Sulfuricellaceae bacterium]
MLNRLLFAVIGLFLSVAAYAANPLVEMKTSLGTITMELYPEKAPQTVDNFLKYVNSGFYKGTVFHRVIDNFMIQGGGYDLSLKQKETRAPIKNEAANGLKNDIYTVAMARTGDPHSASAQFFINVKDNDFLNYTAPTVQGYGYCVFGKVVKGMDVVQQIAKLKTGPVGPMPSDVPLTPVLIADMHVVTADAAKPKK